MKRLTKIHEEIRPTLESLEPTRLLYRKRSKIYGTLVWLPVAGLVAAGFAIPGAGILFWIGAAVWFVISIIIYQFRAGSVKRDYCRNYKNTVIPELLSLIDPQLEFEPEGGIPANEFSHTELFTTAPDRYSTEDLIFGHYGRTALRLAEVHAEDRRTTTDSKGRTKTTYVTIFKGLLLIADFNKHFHGRTFVFPDKAEKLFGGFGRIFQKLGGRSETDLIQLENVEFEKRFAAYSTDEVEARYILSTSLMERLVEMRDRFGKDVRMGFKDSSLLLAVPHGKSFLEPKTNIPATETSQIDGLWEEICYFLDTIEELNLNTRIWTKK